MRILVTNDDGIDSPGLRALAGAVVAAGHEVVVVAPRDDRSGCGAGMVFRPGIPVATTEKTFPDLPGVPFIGIEGTPALAVMLARIGAFGAAPWCVVSGINRGSNTGRAILHSGTVGAPLTAASLGMSGLAVSLHCEEPQHLDTAAAVAQLATQWLVTAQKRTVLNVNVPDIPIGDVRGIRWARLAAVGQRVLHADRDVDEALRMRLATSTLPADPNTDAYLVSAGYVTVTPISALQGLPDDSCARALDEEFESTRTGPRADGP